jgi:nitronate monooxygenase
VEGVSLEDIQKSHNEAVGKEDKGFGTGLKGRAAIWAGTGVGMVNEVEGASEIVEGVRAEVKEIVAKMAKL